MNDLTLVKFPTRSRPALFLARLPLWLADPTVRVLVTIDVDDPTCFNGEFVEAAESSGRVSVIANERPAGKVAAINHGVAQEQWDFLIVGSDDVLPMRSDYASYLRGRLFDAFPDGDGVIHQDDGRAGRALNTIPICGRRYFDRTGTIYHSAYTSLHCDNEWQDVSEGLGRWMWLSEVVLRHEWTDALPGGVGDDLHCRNESYYEADGRTYEARKSLGFPK